jgi:hypothetical protein
MQRAPITLLLDCCAADSTLEVFALRLGLLTELTRERALKRLIFLADVLSLRTSCSTFVVRFLMRRRFSFLRFEFGSVVL